MKPDVYGRYHPRKYRRLGCEVLDLAIRDMFGPIMLPTGYQNGHDPQTYASILKKEARDFLLTSRRFEVVCDLAGLEPSYIRRKLLEVFNDVGEDREMHAEHIEGFLSILLPRITYRNN